jgi:DNA repair exonuclease SbcCD ATPase subunit
VQQELRHKEGKLEDGQSALAALQAAVEHRLDDVARGLTTATHHLGVPAAVMEELEALEKQSQALTAQLDTIQWESVKQRDEAHRQELEQERDSTVLELSSLQAQLEECRMVAGALHLLSHQLLLRCSCTCVSRLQTC